MECKYSYKDYIICGSTEIIADVGLTPATDYTTIIENKGAKYFHTYTTDDSGNITIDFSNYPDGFFNPYAGDYLFSIDSGCEDVLFCNAYKYIQFEVLNGNGDKNTISCCVPPEDSIIISEQNNFLIQE